MYRDRIIFFRSSLKVEVLSLYSIHKHHSCSLLRLFGHDWQCPVKQIASTCRKVWRLSAYKRPTSSLPCFFRYFKGMETCYFGYSGHAWLWPPKTMVSAGRKLWCYLHTKKQIYPSPISWKIVQNYQFVLIGTLAIPSHAPEKQ